MSEWVESKIDELTSDIIDCVNKTAPVVDYVTPYKMIRTSNVKEGRLNVSEVKYVEEDVFKKWTRRGTLQENDVILTREAPLGEVARITNETNFFLGQRLVMYRPDINKIDPDFLFYAMLGREVKYQIKAFGMGSTVEHMRVPDCSEIIISHPVSIEEQAHIGKTLSSLDKKITLLRQQNQTLEELAQTLFKRWFVEFEFPFDFAQGKPDENGRPYKSSGGKMVESELGEIPEGWRVGLLSEILEIKYGKDHKHLANGDYPVYGSGGVMRYVNDYLYNKPSILLPRKGTLSNIFYLEEPFWSVDTMFYSKIKKVEYGKYCFQLLKRVNLSLLDVGSAVPSLSTSVLNEMDVLIPPFEIVNDFEETLTPLYHKNNSNKNEIQGLTQLRDTLLPKLMSGEVRINDSQI